MSRDYNNIAFEYYSDRYMMLKKISCYICERAGRSIEILITQKSPKNDYYNPPTLP